MSTRVAAGIVALCALATLSHAQLYSEFASPDLPNIPFIAPNVNVITGGVTFCATGVVTPNNPDVDFINVTITFPTTQLVFDLDHLASPLEDAVMGIDTLGGFPNPGWVNDDDFNVPLDAIAGHTATPRDCLLNVGALLGNPAIIPPGTYTVAIGRTGEQFIGWNGTANNILKLEYQLYVYANPLPAPGAAGLAAVGVLLRRRRR